MNSKTVNTLVIGGAGYIGSHLVPQLISTGRNVTVLGRSVSPRYRLPVRAKYVAGDFIKTDSILRLLDTHQEVIHLAYATVPNTSLDNPLGDLIENVAPLIQLFSEIAYRNIKLLLVSSGGTVYGEVDNIPINEMHLTEPISPYGLTKLTMEHYAHLCSVTHGLKYTCVRPSNAFGVGQRPFVGQGFIATAIASSMQGLPIMIYGDGKTVRDYLYIDDLVSGILSVLKFGVDSQIYNIGSGTGRSNIQVIEMIKPLMEEINCKIRVDFLPARLIDVKYNVIDSTKLRNLSGWHPQISFEDGLLFVRDWLRLVNGKK